MANKLTDQVIARAARAGADCRGSFRDIESAERAFCKLQASGLRDDCISLEVVDDCPACAAERAGMADPIAEIVIARAQGAGALAGSALGLGMVGWPGSPVIGGTGWVDGFAALCVIGAWGLSGAILGALAGAAVTELPIARRGGRPPHRHYVLVLRPPSGMEQRAIAVLVEAKARIEPE
ncbi:MAG TPA: hypothetical protein V6D00_00120 [Pantanalinema sp.]